MGDRTLRLGWALLLSAAFVSFGAGSGFAQTGADSASTVVQPSVWSELIGWILAQQRAFHEALTQAFRTLADTGEATAAVVLIGVSFLYGVFHAAGPGHGKVVLATYLATHAERIWRGVGLAVAASVCQGLVAVALILGAFALADWIAVDGRSAVKGSERVSFVLLMLLGTVLAVKSVLAGYGRLHDRPGVGCRHAHVPPPPEQKAVSDGAKIRFGVVLSIGLRPCTGAVIILVVAQLLTLTWAGIAAVAAMSLGTALAVSLLAFLVVGARAWADRLVGYRGTAWLLSVDLLALAGGLILVAIGFSLLQTSFAPAHPLGLL